MGLALSKDLRKRVVDAYHRGEGTYRDLAERFGLGEASVSRFLRLHRETGKLDRRARAGGMPPKISNDQLPLLRDLVAEKPDRTAEELSTEWQRRFNIVMSRSAMVRALLRAGLTVKKSPSVRASASVPTSKRGVRRSGMRSVRSR